MTPIRVAQVLGGLEIGGAELRTIALMSRLRDEVEVHYVVFSAQEGALASRVRASGGQVHVLPLRHTFPLNFSRFLKERDIDVVHSHVHEFSGAVLAIAAARGIPTRIAHFRSDGDGHTNSPKRALQRLLMRSLLNRFSTNIVGISPGTLEAAWRADWPSDTRCVVIPNGFESPGETITDPTRTTLRSELSIPESATLLGFVGRPAPVKNRAKLVGTLNAVRAMGVDARLLIVGPQDDEQDRPLTEAALASDVGAFVHFLGARNDLDTLNREFDVLLLPSFLEGVPGVAVEARMVGTPVVASDLPGVRYIKRHLGGITLANPMATDDTWAGAVLAALGEGRDGSLEAKTRFERSPFVMEHAVTAMRQLYGLIGTQGGRT